MREFGLTIISALVIAALVRSFLLQPFYIPSLSMFPTLDIDDKIVVSKLEPDLLELERGDVVVFENPSDWISGTREDGLRYNVQKGLSYVHLAADPDEQFLVKRAIGLPGDIVECAEKGGKLQVNGVEVDERYINNASSPCSFDFEVTVPEGNLWVMGDNRGASADSAYREDVGKESFVPIDNVQGKAVAIVWPISRWGRL